MPDEEPTSFTTALLNATESNIKNGRANKWEVQLRGEEQLKAIYLKKFLWDNHVTPRDSKYTMLQFCIVLVHDVMCDREIIELRDLLFELGAIPKKSLIDAMTYIVTMGKQSIREAINQLEHDKEKVYEKTT